ncbi:helix-turn-helix domain-containing protein [Pelagibius sp.]
MLAWSQRELAERSGLSVPTIKRLESGNGLLAIRLTTLKKLQSTLEAAGIRFIPENGGGPGVRIG